MSQGTSADRICAWVDEQADAAQLPAFVEALAAEILQAAVPEPEVGPVLQSHTHALLVVIGLGVWKVHGALCTRR